MKKRLSVLILAAGAGTRMKSALPKVLHPLGGVPLALRVLRTVYGLKPASVAVIVGHGGKEIVREVHSSFKTDVVWQKTQAGSGHAVKCASAWIARNLRRSADLLVLCGDTPLISGDTHTALWARHRALGAGATILTAEVADPFGYGRIVRDGSDGVRGIVEEKDAAPEERRIREINSGIYCFDARSLLKFLPRLKNDNAKREYYLTDVIGLMSAEGLFHLRREHRGGISFFRMSLAKRF